MNVNEIIGNNLKKYRSAYNMTLNELSERLHKSISTISKYEKGSIAMDIPTFLEISQIFQISPSILLSGAFTLSEDHSPTQKEAERLYMYTYSGMEKEIIQSLIEQFHQTLRICPGRLMFIMTSKILTIPEIVTDFIRELF